MMLEALLPLGPRIKRTPTTTLWLQRPSPNSSPLEVPHLHDMRHVSEHQLRPGASNAKMWSLLSTDRLIVNMNWRADRLVRSCFDNADIAIVDRAVFWGKQLTTDTKPWTNKSCINKTWTNQQQIVNTQQQIKWFVVTRYVPGNIALEPKWLRMILKWLKMI